MPLGYILQSKRDKGIDTRTSLMKRIFSVRSLVLVSGLLIFLILLTSGLANAQTFSSASHKNSLSQQDIQVTFTGGNVKFSPNNPTGSNKTGWTVQINGS